MPAATGSPKVRLPPIAVSDIVGETVPTMGQQSNSDGHLGVPRIADDFVLLTGSCAASPETKISVTLGRFDLEMNGVQMVDVWHDPRLAGDRLFMPESESPFYIEPTEPRELQMIPFMSGQRTNLFSIGFVPRSEGSALVFSAATYDEHMANLMARHLSEKIEGAAGARPFELLRLIVNAIGKLTDWPLDVGFHGPWSCIEVRAGQSFLTAISGAKVAGIHREFPSEGLISVLALPR